MHCLQLPGEVRGQRSEVKSYEKQEKQEKEEREGRGEGGKRREEREISGERRKKREKRGERREKEEEGRKEERGERRKRKAGKRREEEQERGQKKETSLVNRSYSGTYVCVILKPICAGVGVGSGTEARKNVDLYQSCTKLAYFKVYVSSFTHYLLDQTQ